MKTIYFDNAATSWPKPPSVKKAMNDYNDYIGGNPGRSGHRLSIDAARIIFNARDSVADLFHIDDPLQIVFTKNCTEALNLAIFGLLNIEDHVITTTMEHNSVMRPLSSLEQRGLQISRLEVSEEGYIDLSVLEKSILPQTKMIIVNHASNVTGSIVDIKEIGKIARRKGVIFCVDAAQSAGLLPINVESMNIDLLAFTGHKSLLGPSGTGGLFIKKGIEKFIKPLIFGGTGSYSEFESQPGFMPDKFESGTPNTLGIAGLEAGLKFLLDLGIDNIRKKEQSLTGLFIEKLSKIEDLIIYGSKNIEKRTSVVSFNIKGMEPSLVCELLDENYHIMCRPGLHCAPSAHKQIGTNNRGSVRFSFGYFNDESEIHKAIEAIKSISIQL